MTSARASRLIVPSLLALTWPSVLGCARRASAESAPALRASASAASIDDHSVQAAALDPRTYGWQAGRWYAYDVKMTTTVSFGEGAKTAVAFDLDGAVQITPARVTPETVTLYVAMTDPRFVSHVPGSQAEFDKVAAQIASTGCFVTLDGGRITEMRTPRGLSPTAANTYRELGTALQLSRTRSPTDRYTATEYDTTGQYVGEYTNDGGPNLWRRRKLRYLGILAAKTTAAGAPGQVVPSIDESDDRLRLDNEGRPETVSLRDTVTVGGAQVPVHSTTALTLRSTRSTRREEMAPDWASLMAGMASTRADEPYGVRSTIESLDAARIHGTTFEQAVAELERLAKEKRSEARTAPASGEMEQMDQAEKQRREEIARAQSGVFIALAAILREQPDAVSRTVQRIRAKSPASDVLVEALSSAATRESQRALVELTSSKSLPTTQRNAVAMALTRTPRPDGVAVDALEKMLETDPFNEIALLGLGTFSRRFRDDGHADQASTIGALLVNRLKNATKATDRLTTLRAITNSGYAPALPDVLAFMSSDDEDVRVAAVRALQSMRDAKVDDVLADRMQSDASTAVRMAAITAAKVREPSDILSRAVENAARTAADPHVRFRAVELLASWLPRRPGVRSVLEQIARDESEPRIRDAAQTAL